MNREMWFDIDELNMIFEDQRVSLENMHVDKFECPALHVCSPEHFGNEDVEEVFLRQGIMTKILDDASET